MKRPSREDYKIIDRRVIFASSSHIKTLPRFISLRKHGGMFLPNLAYICGSGSGQGEGKEGSYGKGSYGC